MRMRKTLLTTVAAAAVVGFAALGAAQAQSGTDSGKGAATPQGTQEQKPSPGGAMMKPQGAAKTPAQSAQGTQSAKPEQRIGQDQQKTTTPQRGAQDEQRGVEQKGTEQDNSKSDVNGQKSAGQGQESRGTSAKLSQDQRTKIQAAIGHNNSAHVDEHFNITVGAVVPRDVHVEVLPENVVEIVPQYEGFDYVIVGDNILIIDPHTMDIVDIIPV
jgi:Protein of unknown function (DUF1236)